MDIPVACSLTDAAARAQLEEWHRLLGAAVASADQVSPAELSLRLRDDLDQLRALITLAQREKACCPFFDFTIRIEAEAVRLHVCVPEDADGHGARRTRCGRAGSLLPSPSWLAGCGR